MHEGQNRGKKIKRKLSKNHKFCGNKGGKIKKIGTVEKFINFVEIGGICNIVTGL